MHSPLQEEVRAGGVDAKTRYRKRNSPGNSRAFRSGKPDGWRYRANESSRVLSETGAVEQAAPLSAGMTAARSGWAWIPETSCPQVFTVKKQPQAPLCPQVMPV